VAQGATYYSVATGNWAAAATWSTTSGGTPGSVGVPATGPVAGDLVNIEGGFTVTVGATAACATLNIASGSTLTVGAFGITVSGTTTLNGTLTHNSATGTKLYSGLVTINSTGNWNNTGNSPINLGVVLPITAEHLLQEQVFILLLPMHKRFREQFRFLALPLQQLP
jgi:hypothetical protein